MSKVDNRADILPITSAPVQGKGLAQEEDSIGDSLVDPVQGKELAILQPAVGPGGFALAPSTPAQMAVQMALWPSAAPALSAPVQHKPSNVYGDLLHQDLSAMIPPSGEEQATPEEEEQAEKEQEQVAENAPTTDTSTDTTPSSDPPPSTPGIKHTVVPGDWLSKLAKRYYNDASRWPVIYEANKDQIANPDLIYPGQVFVIPPLPGTNVENAPKPTPDQVAPTGADLFHTVVPGDWLSKLARKYYGDATKWPVIFEANKDKIKNPDLIYPGQVFRIPSLKPPKQVEEEQPEAEVEEQPKTTPAKQQEPPTESGPSPLAPEAETPKQKPGKKPTEVYGDLLHQDLSAMIPPSTGGDEAEEEAPTPPPEEQAQEQEQEQETTPSTDTTEGSDPPASLPGLRHTVVEGDWLSKLALRYYKDASKWPVIFEANKDQIANPDLIYPGQVFVIPPLPGVNTDGAPTPSSDEVAPTSADLFHTVVSGDWLSKLARRYYGDATKWPVIYEANKDKIRNPDLIYPGQVFRIPNLNPPEQVEEEQEQAQEQAPEQTPPQQTEQPVTKPPPENGPSPLAKKPATGGPTATVSPVTKGEVYGDLLHQTLNIVDAPVEEVEDTPPPPPTKVVVTSSGLELKEKIQFDFDKATIKTVSRQLLRDAAAAIVAHPEVGTIHIDGFTCDMGSTAYNQSLSERRAAAVKEHLEGSGWDKELTKVPAGRLIARGFGEDPKYLILRDGKVDRVASRRVEFNFAVPQTTTSTVVGGGEDEEAQEPPAPQQQEQPQTGKWVPGTDPKATVTPVEKGEVYGDLLHQTLNITDGTPGHHEPPDEVEVTTSGFKLDERIQFRLNEATILPASFRILVKVARTIHAHPEIARIYVDGFTCDLAAEDYNEKLSKGRAEAVVRFLEKGGPTVGQAGVYGKKGSKQGPKRLFDPIKPGLLQARWYGEDPEYLIRDGKGVDRVASRRVEFNFGEPEKRGSAQPQQAEPPKPTKERKPAGKQSKPPLKGGGRGFKRPRAVQKKESPPQPFPSAAPAEALT